MATSLEERFNLAVQTIQNLPPDGFLQPSNLTKLIFYGFYKQATVGPCKDSKPSMFNYIARAKWEAWDRYRALTKEQAMQGYIDEIRKIVETMPQSAEVTDFAKSMGLSNDSVAATREIEEGNVDSQTVIVPLNPSLSSSSSSSSSSISTSDIDEFYDDPSDLLALEIIPNEQPQSTNHPPSSHSYIRHPQATSARPPSVRHVNQTHGAHYSTSSIASGNGDGQYPVESYNRETQRAILTALTKLQRDLNHILERLNRLETSAYLLQQREIVKAIELNSSSKWFPLCGCPRRTIAFILFWPFIAYLLIRFYRRAKIIIRFRR